MSLRLEGVMVEESALALKSDRLEFADPILCPFELSHLGLLVGTY